ncbi:MAG: ASKHA domain-containing protein [Opitutaceae bacterium]|nr:ASKHA domain-containing protein [Opitutaceae bacterium]
MHRRRLLATATAAGPAFEGGRLARGTRAVAVAVAHVHFDSDFPPALEVIPPARGIVGLCGSAYVDFLAQGRPDLVARAHRPDFPIGLADAAGRTSASLRHHAIESGLLPGFRPEQIDVVGNTALGGAWLALIDRTVLPEMIAASTAAEVVELNLEPGFEDTYIDHLALP